MQIPDINITLIQSELNLEDKSKNLAMFSEKISSISNKTDLIILPEMFSTGFTMNAKAMAETMDGPSVKWMREKAIEKNCVVTGSLIISENGKYFNRLIWARPDGHEYYDKRHLFSYAGENETYTQGKNKIIVDLKGWKISPLICYDLRFPVWSRRTVDNNYDLLIYVANWPERRVNAWRQLLIARAIENQCYVAGVNRTGNDGNNIFHSGESAVLDFKGDYMSNFIPSESSVKSFTLSKDPLDTFRKQFAFFEDRDEFEVRV
jgi:omega-amidase